MGARFVPGRTDVKNNFVRIGRLRAEIFGRAATIRSSIHIGTEIASRHQRKRQGISPSKHEPTVNREACPSHVAGLIACEIGH
jgi:hypothetical protein